MGSALKTHRWSNLRDSEDIHCVNHKFLIFSLLHFFVFDGSCLFMQHRLFLCTSAYVCRVDAVVCLCRCQNLNSWTKLKHSRYAHLPPPPPPPTRRSTLPTSLPTKGSCSITQIKTKKMKQTAFTKRNPAKSKRPTNLRVTGVEKILLTAHLD